MTSSSTSRRASGMRAASTCRSVRAASRSTRNRLRRCIAGGIAFQDLPAPHDATASPADSDFDLYGNLATAMLPPDGEPTYVRMRFSQSLRGLAVDAPVEFLGIDVGHVVSINIDYDEKTQTISDHRGRGRLRTAAWPRANQIGGARRQTRQRRRHVAHVRLARRTRAARRGAQRQFVDRATVDQPGLRSEGAESRLRCQAPGRS